MRDEWLTARKSKPAILGNSVLPSANSVPIFSERSTEAERELSAEVRKLGSSRYQFFGSKGVSLTCEAIDKPAIRVNSVEALKKLFTD